MNARILLVSSAVVLMLLGVGLLFLSGAALPLVGLDELEAGGLVGRWLGAALLGWGFLNWTARGTVLGGTYGRPIVAGNLVHFVTGAFTLLRAVAGGGDPPLVWVLMGLYLLFAAGFSYLLFGPTPAAPSKKR